jgi:hypothetical protein
VRTAINDREPFFREQQRAKVILYRVLREAEKIFIFEMRGLVLEGARLSFYIKPTDGFHLPAIMKWLKQTFAVRFYLRAGKSGHIWGDRYWSRVLEGEPSDGAGVVDWKAVEAAAEPPTPADMRRKLNKVRPHQAEKAAKTPLSPKIPLHTASPPA